MIPAHCRHRTYPEPPGAAFPTECELGVKYADLAERPLARCRRGSSCAKLEPWTQAEIDAHKAETDAIVEAFNRGVCSGCGAELLRRGTAFECPEGHVSGFACGRDDIREGRP